MDGTTSAFFYGTLMAPAVLNRVTTSPRDPPRQKPLGPARPAILYNHRRHRVSGADYPAIVPVESHTSTISSAADKDPSIRNGAQSDSTPPCVRGVYVDGLTASDIFRLDLFEGSQYTRRKVNVTLLPSSAEEEEEEKKGEVDAASTQSADSATCVVAQTYIWSDSQDELEDYEWDFDEFVREKMWRWAPAEFRELDKAIETSSDSGGGGGDSKEVGEGVSDNARTDPTGGRSLNGKFEEALLENDQKKSEVLESAV